MNITNTPKNSRRQRKDQRKRKSDGMRRRSIKNSGRHLVDEVACSHNCITPKMFGYVHMKQEGLSNIKMVSIFVLSNTIRLWSVRESGLMYNAFVR
jgi:signal-transduction protein with cAMP-binding, CBS, and nucleotidyltransferase domain